MPAPVITPAGPLAKRGKDVQAFTATNGVTSWATSGGTLSGTGAAGATWTAPNVGGIYTVTATNASGSTQVTITVTGVVPFMPSWEFEPEDDKKVLVFDPDVGDRQTRTKGTKSTFPFVRNNCQKAELDEMRAFHAAHYPGKKVYFQPPDDSDSLWWIDSGFKMKRTRTNLASYSFVLRKA